jgi:hypothetical protein
MEQDGSLDDLGRELRERVEHEIRHEAEMLERDSVSFELRRRRIGDLAIELLSRGDIVTIIAGSKSIKGRLSFARGRLASLETVAGRVDVNLRSVALRVEERATEGGVGPRPGAGTLRACLLEYDMEGTSIEIWAPSHDLTAAGPIVAVGRDHVILAEAGDTELAVMLKDIAWVRALP